MRTLDRIRFRLRTLFQGQRAERELDAEMRFHLENLIEQKRAAGLSAAEARDAAFREMGSIGLYKEACRDSLGIRLVRDLRQDLGYGLRMLARSPGFTAVAVLSLALGIGANTAIFTLIDAVVLRELPVKDPQALVQVALQTPNRPQISLSYQMYEGLARTPDLFESVFIQRANRFAVGPGGDALPLDGAYVTGNFFQALGVSAARGRTLEPADDIEGGGSDGPVAAISYRYWIGRYGGDPAVVGRAITVNQIPMKIAGVLPAAFSGVQVGSAPAIFVPLRLEPMLSRERSMLHREGTWWLRILARTRPGISAAQTRAALQTVWPSIQKTAFGPETPKSVLAMKPDLLDGSRGVSGLRADFSRPLLYLMGIAGMVLLIACANIANLLLARSRVRRQEIAVRLSLGASRARVIRQLITESVLLSGTGAALGVAIAWPASRLLVSLISTSVWLDVRPDARILAFAVALALVTGVLFGGGPALRAISESPKESTRTVSGRAMFGKALVVAQVALSLALLIAAGLFARTFWNLTHEDVGFDRHNLYMAAIDPRDAGIEDAALARMYTQLYEKLNREPGIQAASLARMVPVADCCWWEDVASAESPRPAEKTRVYLNNVTPGYFASLGTPLLAGRDFTLHDGPGSPLVAVVNEAVAKHFFPGMNAVGRHFSVDGSKVLQNVEIIGIVKSTNENSLRDGPEPGAYFSFLQADEQRNSFIMVRTKLGGAAVQSILRRNVHALSPRTPVNPESVDRRILETATQDRLTAILADFFGVLAVSLVCVGLYGLMSYTVARRTGEIGIRMALGAEGGRVRWMMLREALAMAGAGILIGIPCALVCAKVLSSLPDMLYGVKPDDTATVAATAVLLLGVAAVAGFLPARRATRIEPMSALRHE
jgi:predicted permease